MKITPRLESLIGQHSVPANERPFLFQPRPKNFNRCAANGPRHENGTSSSQLTVHLLSITAGNEDDTRGL
jgi:hypothetical protein